MLDLEKSNRGEIRFRGLFEAVWVLDSTSFFAHTLFFHSRLLTKRLFTCFVCDSISIFFFKNINLVGETPQKAWMGG